MNRTDDDRLKLPDSDTNLDRPKKQGDKIRCSRGAMLKRAGGGAEVRQCVRLCERDLLSAKGEEADVEALGVIPFSQIAGA